MTQSPFVAEALPKTRSMLDKFNLAVTDLLQRNIAKRVKNGIPANSLPPLSPKQKKYLGQMMQQLTPAEQTKAIQGLSQQSTGDALQG